MKNIIIGVVLFTLIFIGLGWLLVGQPEKESSAEFTITENDHVAGNASASATLIEYSDFQCPACASYHSLVNQLKDDLGENLQIVYRHFPLRSIHDHAQLAAQASEAAANQDMFWQMHDLLFENQAFWSTLEDPTETFLDYASELELDIDQFNADLNSQEVEEKVNTDYQSAIQAGVNSTPTFFLNGKKLSNPATYETFKSLIEAEL